MTKLYRVVEAWWLKGERVEKDIGCEWKTERLVKEEMKAMKLKQPGMTFSIQRKDKK